jgi:hypothetical protein
MPVNYRELHDTDEIARRTRTLMEELGRRHAGRSLQDLGWTFSFDRARTRLGLCTWRRGRAVVKRISLSRPLAERLGWDVMHDVARHEIAHALDYEARGRSAHDAAWKTWAVRCGADPTATYDGPLGDDPEAPLLGRCTRCDFRRPMYRAPLRTHLCPDCRRHGHFAALAVHERGTGRPVPHGAAAAPWVGTCPSCAMRIGFARRPAGRRACAACCSAAGGRFDSRFMLRVARRS